MYDIFVNKYFHDTISFKYKIKKPLVSWIVRKFTKNPQMISDIEVEE